ncbi:hypothetical protein BH24BAC1_BH24BAC1_30370 [soil metagenome]
MKLLMKLKELTAVALVVALVGLGQEAFAQGAAKSQQKSAQKAPTEKFSTLELKQFVAANERAFAVQKESEKAMLTVIQEAQIDIDKFNEIAQAHQDQKLDQVKASPEELAAFNKAAQRIVDMQPVVHQTLVQAIEQDGMTIEKFEKIMVAYQQNPAVQEKVQKLIVE